MPSVCHSADTSRRTKRKHLELAAQGKLPGGRAPYGWIREDRRTLVPEEAETLRKAVRDFLGGVRWASNAQEWRDKGTARDYATKYLLSGIARCGRCGAKMRAFLSYRKSKTSSQFRYACPGKNDGGCGGVARAGEPVDRLIRNAVFLN
ncbi:recombinase zinc beta ribbon domain-containing protein [Streptomyces sp. NPDC001020]